jgi:predicted phage tail protein
MKSSRRFSGSPFLVFIFLPISILPFFGPRRTNATLSWDPSPDKRVVNYRIYYTDMTKTKAGKAKSIDVGRTTQATVSNLVAGHTYYFVVRALDQAGRESEPSNLVKYVAGSRPPNSK